MMIFVSSDPDRQYLPFGLHLMELILDVWNVHLEVTKLKSFMLYNKILPWMSPHARYSSDEDIEIVVGLLRKKLVSLTDLTSVS